MKSLEFSNLQGICPTSETTKSSKSLSQANKRDEKELYKNDSKAIKSDK